MTNIRQNHSLLTFILVLVLNTSCASKDVTQPADVYFKRAMAALDDNDRLTATEMLQNLNNQHPFSPYADQVLLELARIEFMAGNRAKASANIDRFLRLHTHSEQLDYAYYLRAMIFFSQDRSILQNYTNIDPSRRDLSGAKKAYKDFEFVVRNFPKSRFAQDSRTHLVYIRSLLASQEVSVGEFYIERKAWLAAINRSNYVLENYIDSRESVAKALDIMLLAYSQMGMVEHANKTRKILVSNFPDYKSMYQVQ